MGTPTRAYTSSGVVAALLGVVTWGSGVVMIKLTTSHFLVVSFYRHAVSIPLLFAAWPLASDRRLSWKPGLVGGFLFAGHQLANFAALRYSTAAIVTILFSTQPIVLGAVGGRFVGDHASRRFYVWSVVAIAGCATVIVSSTRDAATSSVGVLLAVANIVAWCAYYLASKRARQDTTTISWMLVMTVVSGITVTAIAVLAGQRLAVTETRELASLAAIGIIPGTLGHFLVTWAHPRIHIAASSALILGVPIVGTIGAAIFADEPIGPLQAVGGTIAIAATAIAIRALPAPVAADASVSMGEVAS